MKAAVNTLYGPPEVIAITDVPKPVPAENEILVKIHATTVNRTDCGFRKPEYLFVYLISGISKPKNKILGTEFAGVVESIGKNVTRFKIGDEVFGLRTFKFGAHAEYLTIAETASVAIKPTNMSFVESTAICDGLMLAITYIRKIDFSKSPRILINGVTGSIGIAGLQLAKLNGAHVTAVGNTKNIALIKSLGADEVVDYLQEDFTQRKDQFDIIFDAVGKSSFFKVKKLLKPGGIYFSTELGNNMQNIWLSLLTPITSLLTGKNGKRRVMFPIPKDNQQDIEYFRELAEKHGYRAIIDRKYSLDEIVDATRYVETGEKTGNVVIEILPSS
jgi:NADPH:quinone reductase-like Zn-dependent oxidoreductase